MYSSTSLSQGRWTNLTLFLFLSFRNLALSLHLRRSCFSLMRSLPLLFVSNSETPLRNLYIRAPLSDVFFLVLYLYFAKRDSVVSEFEFELLSTSEIRVLEPAMTLFPAPTAPSMMESSLHTDYRHVLYIRVPRNRDLLLRACLRLVETSVW